MGYDHPSLNPRYDKPPPRGTGSNWLILLPIEIIPLLVALIRRRTR